MDGTRVDQLPAFHGCQRRLDVRRLHVGDTHAWDQTFSGEDTEHDVMRLVNFYHGRMARGGHAYPPTFCGRATPETALVLSGVARPQVFYPFGHRTPMTFIDVKNHDLKIFAKYLNFVVATCMWFHKMDRFSCVKSVCGCPSLTWQV
jgi:hypothetical protein